MIGYRNRRRQYVRRIAIGSTLAAVAGYVAGVLTAPKSGKETRADIRHATGEGISSAEKELKKLHTELDKVIKDGKVASEKAGVKAKKELKELLAKANKSKQKAREVLSAAHEGSAADKDLDKAVKDAKTALKHLRSYLKK